MLDDRSKQVLCAIIQSYISRPDPVGSRYVTKKYDFGFSPATIRNIMADLEDMGFLSQPHTSAGRVPTDKGYRFYVDMLMSQRCDVVDEQVVNNLMRSLESIRNDMSAFFAEVSAALSRMSNYMSIAQLPKAENTTLERIELIKFKEDSVVAVLLTTEGVMKNKMLRIDPDLTQADLNRIADYLNSEYSGCTIDEIRSVLTNRLVSERLLWNNLITRAIIIYEQVLSFSDNEFFVEGLYDVMSLPDFSDISKIKEISRAIKDKHIILKIIESLSKTEGVQVIIGAENPVEELNKLSIVASTYGRCSRAMGVIALIGPTRMDYSKAINMVDMVSRCICRTLDEH